MIQDRFDLYDIPKDTKFDMTDEGYYKGTAIITHTGKFPYLDKETKRVVIEARLDADVFDPKSMESFTLKPITNDHPKTKDGLIDANTIKQYQVGMTGSNVRRDGDNLLIDMVITDKDTINLIKKGKKALSCGYRCDTIEAPVGSGADYIQTNIIGNHVSLVNKGRANKAKINTDTQIHYEDDINIKENTDGMKTIQLDSVDYQADEAVIDAYKAQKTRADNADISIASISAEKSKLEGERDSIKTKLDSLEKELADLKAKSVDASKLQEMVKNRVALEGIASKAGVEVKMDSADLDIKKAIILKLQPKAVLEGKDEVYINARYDASIEDMEINAKKDEDAKSRLAVDSKVNVDSNDVGDVLLKAQMAYRQNLADASKGVK